MKLLIALALAAAPSALAMAPYYRHRRRRPRPDPSAPPASLRAPPKVSTPPSHAGRVGYDRATGELPGQSERFRARPASIAPIRTETKELKTQAFVEDVTFKCYDTPVTVPKGGLPAVCPEEP